MLTTNCYTVLFIAIILHFVADTVRAQREGFPIQISTKVEDAFTNDAAEKVEIKVILKGQSISHEEFFVERTTDSLGLASFDVNNRYNYQLLFDKKGYFTQIINLSAANYSENEVLLPVSLRPKNCNKVIGKIKGDLKDVQKAIVKLYQLDSNRDTLLVRVRPDGSFRICLPASAMPYFAHAEAEGFTSQPDSFLVGYSGNVALEQNLKVSLDLILEPIDEPQEEEIVAILTDDTLSIKNLQFDQKTINPKTSEEENFESLVKLFLDHPEIELELSIHTDSRKSERYNMILAKNRAKYLEKYLLENGIAASRFTLLPVGENGLINNCKDGVRCSESEHQANNRVAVRVLKGEESLLEN